MPSPFSSSSSSSLLPSSPPITTPSLTLRSSYSSSTSSFATSAPQRDLFSTFGTLASTYGANASAFIPVHAIPGGVVSTSRRTRKSLKERLRLLVPNSLMPSPAPTRVALPQSPPPAKDYEGAFGALQSTYGLCATVYSACNRKFFSTEGVTALRGYAPYVWDLRPACLGCTI